MLSTDNKAVVQTELKYYDSTNDIWVTIGTSNTENISWDTTQLSDGSYLVQASAVDAAGNRSQTKEKTFIVDNTGPSKPVITSTSYTSTTVTIKWSDNNESDFSHYVVEKKNGNEFEIVGRESQVLGMNITNLDSNTTYIFRVVGYDDLNNRGTVSDEITVATSADNIKPYISNKKPKT